MTAADIARPIAADVHGDPRASVDSWAFDSRALRPGACFVALRGTRDGHDFVRQAFEAGAHVALIDRDVSGLVLHEGRAVVRAGDSLDALQTVAGSVRSAREGLRVVAVAGSTGKTSTKDLLAAALASSGCYANEESYNNEFGLPITLLNTPASATVVVTEMGERKPGDVARLCQIARPEIGVVTNVGLAHAEFLGGTEGAAATMRELLDELPPGGLAVLNADDPWTEQLAAHTHADVATVGHSIDADHRVSGVRLDDRLRASFELDGCRLGVPLHGAHQVLNAAMAVVVAHRAFGVPLQEIGTLLAGTRAGRWRMELEESSRGVVVLNDSYNANPSSMEAGLLALAHVRAGGRRIAVLGDMRELGAHADRAHAAIGRKAAELGIDLVVGVGPGGRQIAHAARDAGVAIDTAADANEAREITRRIVRPGDAVLVKASRALRLEAVADALLEPGDAS
jgi:UDP-N-acetylmuramoyl-tripeptide--D-alanyl-D-alanine ligase